MHKINLCLLSLDRICQNNPKYYKDSIQKEATVKRMRAAIIFSLFGISATIIQTLIHQTPMINGSFCIMIGILIILSVYFTRNLHPQVFKILLNSLLALSGPSLQYISQEGLYKAWMGIHTYPLIVFVCTGSLTHYLVQSLLQIFFISNLYQSEMISSLSFLPADISVQFLIKGSKSFTSFAIVSIVALQVSLQDAHEKVTEAEREKNEIERQKTFLLGFSHELRNLINSVMGNVKLASMENLSEKAKDFLRNADVCGELLLHLINNILDTGKVEVGDLEINPTPTDMHEHIERTWSICSELIRRKTLNGILKVKKDLPRLMKIDHYRLTQILLNVIGNAVKFTEKGVIDVTIEWISGNTNVNESTFEPIPFAKDDFSEGIFEKNQKLSQFCESFLINNSNSFKINSSLFKRNQTNTKGLLKVSICDTGSGISNEDIPRLFQRFTQVTSDLSKKKLGTGLGLFITKELCERMNGDIRAFSKEDHGSCFTFCIPAEALPDERVDNILSCPISMRSENYKLRTMIVDDESFCRLILSNFFSKLNFEVVTSAENGCQAYQKYVEHTSQSKNCPINLITMDITMPVMDGKKSAEKIREYERLNKIIPCILIIISGNCGESEIKECLNPEGKIRANGFIKKPATFEELSRILRMHFKTIQPSMASLPTTF